MCINSPITIHNLSRYSPSVQWYCMGIWLRRDTLSTTFPPNCLCFHSVGKPICIKFIARVLNWMARWTQVTNPQLLVVLSGNDRWSQKIRCFLISYMLKESFVLIQNRSSKEFNSLMHFDNQILTLAVLALLVKLIYSLFFHLDLQFPYGWYGYQTKSVSEGVCVLNEIA